MTFKFRYEKSFLKDLKTIRKGDPNRISQIKEIIELIKQNPQNPSLHYEKLKGYKELKLRYLVGMKYRIQIEIVIKNNLIIFERVGRRENFY